MSKKSTIIHPLCFKADQAQSAVTHIPDDTPRRTPLGLAPKTRNFLRVF